MVPEKGVLFIANLNWASTILYLCQRPMHCHITLYRLLRAINAQIRHRHFIKKLPLFK